MYAVVINYDKKTDTVTFLTMDDDLNTFTSKPSKVPLSDLALICIRYKFTPYNFSLNRSGEVIQDSGAFSRFHSQSAIVLAEFITKSGTRMGYKLLQTGKFINRKTDDIINKDKVLGEDTPYLQNGIIRGNAVCCYPNHNFKIITIGKEEKKIDKPIKVDMKESEVAVTTEPVEIQVADTSKDPYTKAQRREIKACKKAGIDSSFIENPDLSDRQMRILWVSKSRGTVSEAFNKPEFSTDVMEFYADRLKDTKTVNRCKPILAHPEYDLARVKALYEAMTVGVDINGLEGKSLSDIETATLANDTSFWGKTYTLNVSKLQADRQYKKLKNAFTRKQLDNTTPEQLKAELDDYFARHSVSSNVDKVKDAISSYRAKHKVADGVVLGVSILGNNRLVVEPISNEDIVEINKRIKKYKEKHPESKNSEAFSVQKKLMTNKDGDTKTKFVITPVDVKTINQDIVYATIV